MNANVGTDTAKRLTTPVKDFPMVIRQIRFDLFRDTALQPEDVTFRNLRHELIHDPKVRQMCDQAVMRYTGDPFLDEISRELEKRFRGLYQNMIAYATQEGKDALYQVYSGSFEAVDGQHGMGVREMLYRLAEENDPCRWDWELHQAKDYLREVEKRVMESPPLLASLDIGGKARGLTEEWVQGMNRLYNVRIWFSLTKAVFGPGNLYRQKILIPMDRLVDELLEF